MARPLFDSEFIFGIHEEGGEHHMLEAGKPGWVLFTEGIGHDPNNRSGRDYRVYSDQGLGVITRLNNGYHPNGTIPTSDRYEQFSQRCANFVANSSGCKIWIIGNEMNYDIERPRYSAQGGPSVQHTPTPEGGGSEPVVDDDSGPPPPPPPNQSWWRSLWSSFTRLFRRKSTGDDSTQARTESADAIVLEPPMRPPVPDEAVMSPVPPDELDPQLRSDPQRFNVFTAQFHAMIDEGPSDDVRDDMPAPPPPPPLSSSNSDVEVLTPELYARCYTLCREAIHAVPGHGDDQVLVGAVAPWNNQTAYDGNPDGDWVQYMQDILNALGPSGCDGITLHTYTHDCDVNLIFERTKMNPPFQHRHFQFRAYRDFMGGIPVSMRHLPVYITESDQDVAWLDRNIGWIQRAYGEIDHWNRQLGNQQIRALILYRWPQRDKWYIEGKHGLIDDLKAALQSDYRWQAVQPEPAEYHAGAVLELLDVVNARRSPGYVDQAEDDLIASLPVQARLSVVESAWVEEDGLIWWSVRLCEQPVQVIEVEPIDEDCWVAQFTPTGAALVKPVAQEALIFTNPPVVEPIVGLEKSAVDDKLGIGSLAKTAIIVNLRKSPGYVDKPEGDLARQLAPESQLIIVDGPREQDGLDWWLVRSATDETEKFEGWLAETAPTGVPLLKPASAQLDGIDPATARSVPFRRGNLVVAAGNVRVRKTPGFVGKADDDTLGAFHPKTVLNVVDGSVSADGLTWWRVGGICVPGGEQVGWVAEKTPNGMVLVTLAAKLPGTDIPNQATGLCLTMPFRGVFEISQLWGERPHVYSQFRYDGAPLLGHNGVDFFTPSGTPLQAVDDGTVAAAGHDPTGFGSYVLLHHPWGESIYAHMGRLDVETGQSIQRAQTLGNSGNTGNSNGPHLHFAIRINPYLRTDGWGGYSDPLPYLPRAQVLLPPYVLPPEQRPPLPQGAPAPAPLSDANAPGMAPDQPGVRRP